MSAVDALTGPAAGLPANPLLRAALHVSLRTSKMSLLAAHTCRMSRATCRMQYSGPLDNAVDWGRSLLARAVATLEGIALVGDPGYQMVAQVNLADSLDLASVWINCACASGNDGLQSKSILTLGRQCSLYPPHAIMQPATQPHQV